MLWFIHLLFLAHFTDGEIEALTGQRAWSRSCNLKPKRCDSPRPILLLVSIRGTDGQAGKQAKGTPVVAGLALGPGQKWGFQVVLLRFYFFSASWKQTRVQSQDSCCRVTGLPPNQTSAGAEAQVISPAPLPSPPRRQGLWCPGHLPRSPGLLKGRWAPVEPTLKQETV